jgi:hypothetical protein
LSHLVFACGQRTFTMVLSRWLSLNGADSEAFGDCMISVQTATCFKRALAPSGAEVCLGCLTPPVQLATISARRV